ncbi:MAG: hypothetical protein V7K96_29095 [Nostoc sp.]
MGMTKLWKFLRNIQELNWGQGVEVTKTGAEAAKAVLDLAKAIKEQKPNVQNFKPYLEQISSLLDVFNSPLGQITKEILDYSVHVKQRRLRWIKALKSGNNPLTPEELEALRQVEG